MDACRPTLLLLLLTSLFPSGCQRLASSREPQEAEEEWPARSLTIWAGRHELFIEHEVPVPPRAAGFAVHVTKLEDGSPRSEGPLRMLFQSGGETVEASLAEPARPGIYLTEVAFPAAGSWQWILEVDGDRAPLPEITACSSEQEARRYAASLPEPLGDITMLKEQQWPVRLRAEAAATHSLEERIPATARVEPSPGRAAWIAAPASGSLLPPPAGDLAALGSRVEVGDLLAVLRVPMFGGDLAGWESASLQRDSAVAQAALGRAQAAAESERAQAELALAAGELQRVEGLHAKNAKSARELEEARYRLAAATAARDAAAGALEAWNNALQALQREWEGPVAPAAAYVDLELRAPVTGRLVHVPQAGGAWLQAGAALYHILDPSRLLVAVRVGESDLPRLAEPARGLLRHAAEESWLELPGERGRVLLVSPQVDPRTRAAEVVFEIPNPGWLRAGMTLDAQLSAGRRGEGITVPESAVVDDDGLMVVYIQTAGETFARRPVRTGRRGGGRVEILAGLQSGERVVVDGAYVVRLVSLSGAIPEHTH